MEKVEEEDHSSLQQLQKYTLGRMWFLVNALFFFEIILFKLVELIRISNIVTWYHVSTTFMVYESKFIKEPTLL